MEAIFRMLLTGGRSGFRGTRGPNVVKGMVDEIEGSIFSSHLGGKEVREEGVAHYSHRWALYLRKKKIEKGITKRRGGYG